MHEKMVNDAKCRNKTGAKIISILGLIATSMTIIGNIIGGLINGQQWLLIVIGHISATFGIKDVTWTYVVLGFAVVTIAQVGYLAMFAMLFHGIKKDRHGFMLPFLIFGMISLVVSYFKSCKFWTIIQKSHFHFVYRFQLYWLFMP